MPGRDRRSRQASWSGRASARRSFPAFPTSATGRADVMRGEEVQLLGAVAAGLVDPMRLVCHPGTHNKWATAAPAARSALPNGHDRRAVQPAEGAQHPRRPAPGRGRSRTTRSSEARALRASPMRRFPPSCSAIRARVLLGQAKKEDARVLCQRPADRHRCADRPRRADCGAGHGDGPARAHPALRRRASSEAGRDAVELDGEQCFLAGIHEIAKRI